MSDSKPHCSGRLAEARLGWLAALVGIITCAMLLGTSPMLPMCWDEGNGVLRAGGVQRWITRWVEPAAARGSPLKPEVIAADWQYTTAVEGHPALYGILIATGQRVSAGWLDPLTSARFGPIVFFAVAAAAMFYRLARDYGIEAGATAVLAMLLMPRLFAHVHLASFDGPLVSAWVLTWALFAPARHRVKANVAFGLALGLLLSSKATGWIAPVLFFVWALVFRDLRGLRSMAVASPLAAVTFYVLNPPLWFGPLSGFRQFLWLNSHRQFNIPTQFFGGLYDLNHPLPWYNGLVWTGITVPTGLLLLALLGISAILRHRLRDKSGCLLIASWAVLLVIRAFPITPPHDAERLILPSFAFLAALAGVGAHALFGCLAGRPTQTSCRLVAYALVLAIGLGSASSLAWYAPQWLSYYNLAIGGLPGASRAGMEPTYYWDSLDRPVRCWLEENTPPQEKVHFARYPQENLAFMRLAGMLMVESFEEASGTSRWYVVQNRPSMWTAEDRWLHRNVAPVFRKVIREGGWGPWRLDVPLLYVYRYSDFQRAQRALR